VSILEVTRRLLTTSIMCPLAVMEQWAEEVRTKTKKGLLTVTTHHGPRRAKRE
jgi:SNF2 family DNA or RNA helicase